MIAGITTVENGLSGIGKMNPETDLPWKYVPVSDGEPKEISKRDYDYIIHACNAYPQLVDPLLKEMKTIFHIKTRVSFLKNLGKRNEWSV